jgi:osmotically inducible protein OsmC
MTTRTGSAVWNGDLKEGGGKLSTHSGALDNTPYGFNTRFEDSPGTNPEELIGAAHAGCFTMALAGQLAHAGLSATRLTTTARVTLDKLADGYEISAVHLSVAGVIPGATAQAFEKATSTAKESCPVSKLLKARITMDAQLEI